MTYPTNFDRYLSCFNPANCHLVPAPQGKPEPSMDGDQPTSGIRPVAEHGVQSIAMYPVDGDFIIFAFRDYQEAKTFALRVGQKYPMGEPEVTTVQPGRIAFVNSIVDLAFSAWNLDANQPYFDSAVKRLAKMPKTDKSYSMLADSVRHSTEQRAKHQARLDAASERDRNLAVEASKVADGSTPSERHIFAAARNLGYTL